MSGKRYRNLTKRETKRAAIVSSHLRGCTCAEPDVHVLRIARPGVNEGHVQVRHEETCPLLAVGTTYDVIVHPEACER